MYDQDRHVLMVNAELFGAVADQHKLEPMTSPTLKNALHFMAAIAELYAEDNIKKERRSQERISQRVQEQ